MRRGVWTIAGYAVAVLLIPVAPLTLLRAWHRRRRLDRWAGKRPESGLFT